MLSCHEASRLLSDRLDRRLRPWERLALRIHLAMCRGCSRADEQLRFLHKAMSVFARRRGKDDPPSK
jgi:hypothetical protein